MFAQRPKLSQFKPAIGRRIAAILEIPPDRVGVKAKTGETIGPVGREEVMQAECVALLGRKPRGVTGGLWESRRQPL